jgi:ADP-ribose pyrophosphatase
VPLTTTGEIVLIHNYRYPLKTWVWELPSGAIAAGESPLEAAQRELLEEAGGTAVDWHLLTRLSTMDGIGTEHANLFLAKGVVLGETAHEAAEVMTVHHFPAAEVIRMARAGEMNDMASVLALLLAESDLKHG